ncbi:hypothetical protein ISCGN_019931 [Ixodes scapularis]
MGACHSLLTSNALSPSLAVCWASLPAPRSTCLQMHSVASTHPSFSPYSSTVRKSGSPIRYAYSRASPVSSDVQHTHFIAAALLEPAACPIVRLGLLFFFTMRFGNRLPPGCMALPCASFADFSALATSCLLMRPASVTALAACSRCIRGLSVTSLHGYHVLLLCGNSYRRTSHDFSPLKTTISCPW